MNLRRARLSALALLLPLLLAFGLAGAAPAFAITRDTVLARGSLVKAGDKPLGTVQVLARSADEEAASITPTDTVDYRFGDSLRLTGIQLPTQQARAGETVPLTLFWRADAPVHTSYTVFVHLLGAQYNPAQNNLLWGQVDRLPLDGKLPTNAWTPGQPVVDPYALKVDDQAPVGPYKIELGLYDAATGNRLHVFDARGQDLGDALIIGQVGVEK